MKLPRVRFTVRRMMVAVAIVAVAIAAEKCLYDFAILVMWEGFDLRDWAVGLWLYMNMGIAVAAMRVSRCLAWATPGSGRHGCISGSRRAKPQPVL
jgi:hypothetical protein